MRKRAPTHVGRWCEGGLVLKPSTIKKLLTHSREEGSRVELDALQRCHQCPNSSKVLFQGLTPNNPCAGFPSAKTTIPTRRSRRRRSDSRPPCPPTRTKRTHRQRAWSAIACHIACHIAWSDHSRSFRTKGLTQNRKAEMGVWTLFWPQKARVVFSLAIDSIQCRQHQSMAPKPPFLRPKNAP